MAEPKTATAERRGRPRSESAETAILEAAIDLLDENGYLGLTVEAVAQRAGVAKTTIYRRWPGKDELVWDAIQRLKGPTADVLPGISVRDDLLHVLLQVRENWANGRHGRVMRRLAADGSERPEHYREFRDRIVRPRQRVVLDVLRRGVDEGLIRPDVDLQLVLDLLIAPIVAAMMTHRPTPTPEQVEFTLDTVLRGIAV